MSNLHPVFDELLKPFYSTGLTTEQRLSIAHEIGAIAKANAKILEIIGEMEDNKKAYAMMGKTEKIGSSVQELFILIK